MNTGVWGLSSCKVLELYFDKCGREVFHKMKNRRHVYMYLCMYLLETKAELVLSSPLDVTEDPGHA